MGTANDDLPVPMRSIRRLLPLLMLAACTRQPRPAAVTPPPSADAGARLPVRITLGMDPVPGQRIVYVVDGVEHTDSAFRALGLEGDEIEWIEVLKCTDACSSPSRVILRTRRTAAPPAPARPPAAPPPDAAALRALLKRSTQPVIYVVDGVQHTDSSFRALDPLDIVSIEVPGGLNEVALPRTGPRYIYIRTRRPASPSPPADSVPRHP
jgi:hypothetical protein